MAEGKKTFIFYSDWINMIREMPDSDAGALLKHILSYVNDENPETENLLVRMAFGHMKPLIKSDLEKWETIREKRSEYGKKGGQAKAKQKLAKAKQVEAVNDNVNVNVNVNDNVNNKKIPEFEEFKTHALSKKENIDIPSLKLKYDSWVENDWKDGNDKKITNWKSKLTNTVQFIKETEPLKKLFSTNR